MFAMVVLAYDGSSECRNALQEGVDLVLRFGAACHLLAVVPPPPAVSVLAAPLPAGLLETETAAMRGILDQGLANLRARGLHVTGTIRMWEEPQQAIVDFATEVGADLVVVGHRRRSTLDRWWCGSVGHTLLDRLPCSLLVSMPPPDAPRLERA